MKSRGTLTLIEAVIMLLVFAVCVSVCLKVFVYADGISKDIEQYGKAHTMLQNTAEIMKYTGGDMEKAAEMLGYNYNNGAITYSDGDVNLNVQYESTEYDCLGGAYITADSDSGLICGMHIRWQEETR